MLGAVDETPNDQPPDFTRYAALLRARAKDPPTVLVAYMIDSAPDLALQTLADTLITDAATRRALLDAAKSEHGAGLERLAQDNARWARLAWWVRLYVANRLQREPTLRTPALVQRLRDDPNPAVRAALNVTLPR